MKKLIKFLLFSGIIISLLVPIVGSARGKYEESQILENLLKELNGEFLEGDINMGGIVLQEFLNKEEIEAMAKDIRSKMGVIDSKSEEVEYFEEFIDEEDFNQLTIYGYDEEANPVTIMIGSYIEAYNNLPETTLFINLIKKGQNFKINGIIDRIENIFAEFDNSVDITTCLIGTLEDDISQKDIIKTMNKFKIKIVEEYIDESIISYTAYTPLIDQSIFSGRKQVNLNLAIRHNDIENKNYIWIGTPIITTGY